MKPFLIKCKYYNNIIRRTHKKHKRYAEQLYKAINIALKKPFFAKETHKEYRELYIKLKERLKNNKIIPKVKKDSFITKINQEIQKMLFEQDFSVINNQIAKLSEFGEDIDL